MEIFWLIGLAAFGIAVVATIRLAQARKEIADLRRMLHDVKAEMETLRNRPKP